MNIDTVQAYQEVVDFERQAAADEAGGCECMLSRSRTP